MSARVSRSPEDRPREQGLIGLSEPRRATFRQLWDRHGPEVRRIAYSGSQRVPGMDADDVFAEMAYCFWIARKTYSKSVGIPLMSYWWQVWVNRKNDLIRFAYRKQRDSRLTITVDDEWFIDHFDSNLQFHSAIPQAVNSLTPQHVVERRIWNMLAIGHTAKEIQDQLRIGHRRYVRILNKWRANPALRERLRKAAE